MSSVNGKVALITGGANGIGAEVARRLHEKGAKLVLTDIDEVLLKEVGTRLGEDRVLTVVADVRDLAAMQSATDKGTDKFGGIDIVMANAGIATYRVGAERRSRRLQDTARRQCAGRVPHRACCAAVGD